MNLDTKQLRELTDKLEINVIKGYVLVEQNFLQCLQDKVKVNGSATLIDKDNKRVKKLVTDWSFEHAG